MAYRDPYSERYYGQPNQYTDGSEYTGNRQPADAYANETYGVAAYRDEPQMQSSPENVTFPHVTQNKEFANGPNEK
jgi:hypothetical protein